MFAALGDRPWYCDWALAAGPVGAAVNVFTSACRSTVGNDPNAAPPGTVPPVSSAGVSGGYEDQLVIGAAVIAGVALLLLFKRR